MRPQAVSEQMRLVIRRLVQTGLAVEQTFPTLRTTPDGVTRIGDLRAASVALRNYPYDQIYADMDVNKSYHVRLPDGGLLIWQYVFDSAPALLRHRLAYFPCPRLPTMEEAPYLYEHDELFADIMVDRIVRFPIRIDYDPTNYRDLVHPKTHASFGQFENCRIPVAAPVLPNGFMKFVLRNFYHRAYIRHLNVFEKRLPVIPHQLTISTAEQRISHLVMH